MTTNYDAVLFDLDGVLTSTASLHAACWKRVFDEVLAEWAQRTGEPQEPFGKIDYLAYVEVGLPALPRAGPRPARRGRHGAGRLGHPLCVPGDARPRH
jgi:beta-phosphoglucomutase-like phosphatase (HAD superfamily)